MSLFNIYNSRKIRKTDGHINPQTVYVRMYALREQAVKLL